MYKNECLRARIVNANTSLDVSDYFKRSLPEGLCLNLRLKYSPEDFFYFYFDDSKVRENLILKELMNLMPSEEIIRSYESQLSRQASGYFIQRRSLDFALGAFVIESWVKENKVLSESNSSERFYHLNSPKE